MPYAVLMASTFFNRPQSTFILQRGNLPDSVSPRARAWLIDRLRFDLQIGRMR